MARNRGGGGGFSPAEQQLMRLTAAVDQVLTLAEAAMRSHVGNRPLVDLALDVRNGLRKAMQ